MTGAELSYDPEDILVVIGPPIGEVEVPLSDWIAKGPGPRSLVRPLAARSRSTGRALPLSVILRPTDLAM